VIIIIKPRPAQQVDPELSSWIGLGKVKERQEQKNNQTR